MKVKANEHAMQSELRQGDFAMSFEEIGQVLGMKRGTVWTIYHRGLRKLRARHPHILLDLRAAALELDAHRVPAYWEEGDTDVR